MFAETLAAVYLQIPIKSEELTLLLFVHTGYQLQIYRLKIKATKCVAQTHWKQQQAPSHSISVIT